MSNSLHNDIMNIPCTIDKEHASNLSYKVGHRDARHAAAELANEADEKIESLEEQLKHEKWCAEVNVDGYEEHIAELKDEADRLRHAIEIVCEGWTLPNDARKVLETALWPQPNNKENSNEN